MEKRRDPDADWPLTYSNLVLKAVEHARKKGLTGDLKEVVRDLLETTKWKPCYCMVKNGVSDYYHRKFKRLMTVDIQNP